MFFGAPGGFEKPKMRMKEPQPLIDTSLAPGIGSKSPGILENASSDHYPVHAVHRVFLGSLDAVCYITIANDHGIHPQRISYKHGFTYLVPMSRNK
jgi:hypothetical protein